MYIEYIMANRWVEFVRKWASENNMNYMCAMTNEKCRAEYKKAKNALTPSEIVMKGKTEPAKSKPALDVLTNPDLMRYMTSFTKGMTNPQRKYDLVKKILMELDRRNGAYGNDTDPYGYVKDFLITPERNGETQKQIVDTAYKHFNEYTSVNYDILHSVMMRKLFFELKKLMND